MKLCKNCNGTGFVRKNSYRMICPECKGSENLVPVCSRCIRACCRQKEFECEDSKDSDILLLTIEQLSKIDRESSHYWVGSIPKKLVYGEE